MSVKKAAGVCDIALRRRRLALALLTAMTFSLLQTAADGVLNRIFPHETYEETIFYVFTNSAPIWSEFPFRCRLDVFRRIQINLARIEFELCAALNKVYFLMQSAQPSIVDRCG